MTTFPSTSEIFTSKDFVGFTDQKQKDEKEKQTKIRTWKGWMAKKIEIEWKRNRSKYRKVERWNITNRKMNIA